MAKYFLTSAIDYANGDPHLGHAFEKIGADAIARYHRLIGDDVHFLIGMDEHGQKVAQTAAERKVSPQELVDAVAESTEQMWGLLGISYDQFIRTTDAAHKAGVKADRADLRELARRLLREGLRRVVLRRLRGVQAGRRDRRRKVRPAPDADARVGRGAQLVLPAERVRRPAEEARGERGFPAAEVAPQRDPFTHRAGPRGHLGQPQPVLVGRSLPAERNRR